MDIVEESNIKKGDIIMISLYDSINSCNEIEYDDVLLTDTERLTSTHVYGRVERIDKKSVVIITNIDNLCDDTKLDRFTICNIVTILRSSIFNIELYTREQNFNKYTLKAINQAKETEAGHE